MDMAAQIHQTRKAFPDFYHAMHWLSPGAARAAEAMRQELLDEISTHNQAKWEFAGTKLYTRALSPGCSLCGQGTWSCLFINGICNARCFYCPSEQKDPGPPMTSSIEFERPKDYADYAKKFGIRGVAFSGGEPMINFDRIPPFLDVLGRDVPDLSHIWMYTNGTLVTTDRLKILRDNGLKEIRFDLSAVDYAVDNLKKAVGIIPIVTVEIPAIPEDMEKTKPLLRKLADLGVNYLNLHQIRCTHFNLPKLIRRGYTFLHGPGVAVLETELAALELIRHSLDNDIDLPINYCAFTYRQQSQKAAARNRNAAFIKKGWEDITPTGFIRNMVLSGDLELVENISKEIEKKGTKGKDWSVGKDGITIPRSLWPDSQDLSALTLTVKYNATALRAVSSMRYPHITVQLNENRQLIIEKDDRHQGIQITGPQIFAFAEKFLGLWEPLLNQTQPGLDPELEEKICRFENFSRGLAPYF
ncbi:radical SAM protein [uncultured Desulfobacter sp.]|uniref:radical SAM protein n=1 Tax=uncultured Desulfobacter sp. TaxID=240139 RepID=UPI0029F45898|nr:radical SAM protein [uncultured Desulfobacter sp.]